MLGHQELLLSAENGKYYSWKTFFNTSMLLLDYLLFLNTDFKLHTGL